MSRAYGTFSISGFLALSLAVTVSYAQSGTTASLPAPDSVAPAPDSAPEEGKKKGGLFGKAKKFVGNKAVEQVAKTVACNVVPGGALVAGAIDAASSKNVGDAAAGAAGAATGQTCMPGGMGGMGGAAAGAMGAGSGMAGVAGMAGVPGGVPGMAGAAGAAGAAGLVGDLTAGAGGALPGGMPGGAMGYGAMPGGPAPEEMASCLLITVDEYLDFTDPTRGEARPATKDEMKQQSAMVKKIDMRRYQACQMQQFSASMAAASQMMAQSGAPAPGDVPRGADATADQEAAAGGKLSEAPGKSVTLSSDPAADLKKGRTVVTDIDWLTSGGDVSEAGKAAFAEAMARLAAVITKAGGTYRADIYLNKGYDDAAIAPLGSARLKAILASLEGASVASGVVTAGKAKKDKKPRLELVKAKR